MSLDPQSPPAAAAPAPDDAAPARAAEPPAAPSSITSDQSPFADNRLRVFSEPPRPPPDATELRPPLRHTWQDRPDYEWRTEYREFLPYWQQQDPVPPQPAEAPDLETPGETLNERQDAFCRAYVECPVAAKAARLAGYSPASARRQAQKLLRHPVIVRRVYELRDVKGKDHHVRRDTIIDQAEAVFEAAMEKTDYYAAMQALTMKARLAGFADYLPGVRIVRRDSNVYEQEFWARAHEAEQKLTALRFGEFAGGPVDPRDIYEAQREAEVRGESAGLAANQFAAKRAAGSRRERKR